MFESFGQNKATTPQFGTGLFFQGTGSGTNDALEKADQRIAEREHQERDRGLLSEGVYDLLHLVSRADEQSLARLKQARNDAVAGKSIDLSQAIEEDHKATDWRNEVTRYTTGFAKTVPLFMGPGKGYALAAAINGADEVRLSTTPQMMALDFGLGAAKGCALKYSIDAFASGAGPLWQKGAMLGGASSLLEVGLSSRTWYDAQQGTWHAREGMTQLVESGLIGAGTGAVAFPLGFKLGQTVSTAAQETFGATLSRPLLGNLAAGWSFGLTGGATGEVVRQWQAGEHLDLGKIALRAAAQSTTDMLAAGTGYKLANWNEPIFERTNKNAPLETSKFGNATERLKWLTDEPSRILDLAFDAAKGNDVDRPMMETIKENADVARAITPEQVRVGLKDILLAQHPDRGLDLLMDTGAMARILPELSEMTGPKSTQDSIFHPEGNVWTHTKMVMAELQSRLSTLPEEVRYTEMLAALLHDAAKPETQLIGQDGRISNPKHAEVGAEKARALLDRLGVDETTTKEVVSIIQDHMRMHTVREMTEKTLDKTLADPYIEAKIRLQASDVQGSNGPYRDSGNHETFLHDQLDQFRAQQEARANEAKPIVTSQMLKEAGVKPGPEMGQILKAAKAAQTEGQFGSEADASRWLFEKFGIGQGKVDAVTTVSDKALTPRINSAVDGTRAVANDYFETTLKTRTVEPKGSRYEDMTPAQLEQAIREANWQPFDHPAIKSPAVAFKGDIPGRLGMIPLEEIPADAPLWLIDPKGTGSWSLSTKGVAGPKVEFSTLILGPEAGKEIVYTIHPGEPVSPSPVSTLPAQIQARLVPGAEARIPVTAAEAKSLGLTMAKIEDTVPPTK